MNRNNNAIIDFLSFVIAMILFVFIAGIFVSDEDDKRSKCVKSSCNRDCSEDSFYCYLHKPSSAKKHNTNSGSSSSSYKPSSGSSDSSSAYSSHNAYDDGYNDIYEDDDYDWDRYQEDDDYASGVDDAMEDVYDEFGDDW